MALCDKLHDDGQTIILVTHEADVAARAGRLVTLRDGLIASDVGQSASGEQAAT